MALPEPFIDEICQYLAANSSGRFAYGDGDKNLKLGEIEAGHNGVFASEAPGIAPDMETPIEYWSIDFWSVNTDEDAAHQDLRTIHQLFHQGNDFEAYSTTSWQIYFSYAENSIMDMGRNRENKKMFKLTILFISRSLIS